MTDAAQQVGGWQLVLYFFAVFGAVGFVLLAVALLAAFLSDGAIDEAFADDTTAVPPRTGGSDADKVDASNHGDPILPTGIQNNG